MTQRPMIRAEKNHWVDVAPGRRQLRYAAGDLIPLEEAVAAGLVPADEAAAIEPRLPRIEDGRVALGADATTDGAPVDPEPTDVAPEAAEDPEPTDVAPEDG